jgi:hypothetical protein
MEEVSSCLDLEEDSLIDARSSSSLLFVEFGIN